jgi:hypothetical protein
LRTPRPGVWLRNRASRATAELVLGGPTRGRGVTLLHPPTPPIAPTCHVDSPQTHRSCSSYPILLHDRSPRLILPFFPMKTRLSARSCTRAYATTSVPRKGIPPSSTPRFPPSLLTCFAADLVQDIYLKELRSYKAPPAVSRPVCMF